MAYKLLDPTAKVLVEGCDAEVAPTIDGDYIYFARKGVLTRCRLDGAELSALAGTGCKYKPFVDGEYVYFTKDKGLFRCSKVPGGSPIQIDDMATFAPFVEGNYVYFANTNHSLFRRKKDGTEKEQMLDDFCYNAPFVKGDYVYFCGHDESLFRRKKDGSEKEQILDGWCRTGIFVDDEYVYFFGKTGLHRHRNDGQGTAQILDEASTFYDYPNFRRSSTGRHAAPVVDGDYVYFFGRGVGLDGGSGLYRCLKDGTSMARLLHQNLRSGAAVKGDWVYFVTGTTLCRRQLHMESEWMKRRWDVVKDLPLWQLAIPSTHDTATYGNWITPTLAGADGRSRCQTANIYEQLMFGYRCFDLRFMPYRNVDRTGKNLTSYGFHHGSDHTKNTLADMVSQITRFLSRTSKEIMILNLRADVKHWQKDSFRPSNDHLTVEEERNIIKKICDRIGHQNIVSRSVVASMGKKFFAGLTPAELLSHEDGRQDGSPRVILLWWGNHDLSPELKDSTEGQYVWLTATKSPESDGENEFSGCLQANSIEDWAGNRVAIQKNSGDKHINVAGSPAFTEACKGVKLEPNVLDELLRQPWNVIGGDFMSEDAYLIGADLIVNGMQGNGAIKK
ncbi:DUF5050 domain-containing protein [Rhizobium tropici]|uniref:Prolow-density lipoprotein receptor-related protein 1-like beta-propeller domain-containing protein n=1 Tax=Rhizobium tropici TaxID=398 RepID=A0A329YBS4_RHITR|nr:DUF5050 domain-containing protein [Rhizobium tropici]RAX37930.1 hypothetical protein DQ393_30105 [Rhizobium tropici]